MISPAEPPRSVRVLALLTGALLLVSTGLAIVRVNEKSSSNPPAAAARGVTTTTATTAGPTETVPPAPESGISGTTAGGTGAETGTPGGSTGNATTATTSAGSSRATTTTTSGQTTASGSTAGTTAQTTAGIYTVAVDGSDLRRIRDGGASFVTWSPTANRLAFGPHASVLNGDGTGLKSLIGGTLVAPPAWSGDGNRLALVIQNGSRSDLVVLNADGSGAHGVTTRGDVSGASWSRNDTIAFAAGGQVYVVNPDGSGLHQLGDSGLAYRAVAWSPDGKWVAFANGNEVDITNSTGTSVITAGLTDGHTLKWAELTWAPDSTRLVFQAGTGGSSTLKVVGYDGTNLHTFADSAMAPDWSPVSANRIAMFTAGKALSNGDRLSDLELANPDRPGYRLKVVNDKAGADESSGPQFSSDGTRLAFVVGGSDSGGPAAPRPSGS